MKKQRLTPITNLPLRPSTLQLLQSKGFDTVEELHEGKACGVAQLASDLGVSGTEAVRIFREVVGAVASSSSATTSTVASAPAGSSQWTACTVPPPKTASQLLEEQAAGGGPLSESQAHHQRGEGEGAAAIRHVITFCRELDQLLGGGVALGELTELSGAPGMGKTQLAMQLAVTARLPTSWGGVEGETLYIDSEGSFSPERCWSMAEALVSHIKTVHRKRRREVDVPAWFTPQAILEGIRVIRVHDEAAQTATLLSLEERLRSDPGNVKLVVVDSIAFHLRASGLLMTTLDASGSGSTHRSSKLQHQKQRAHLVSLAAHLNAVAARHRVAVVATNHMTTVKSYAPPQSSGPGIPPSAAAAAPASESFTLVPALGEAWAHAVSARLVLYHPSDGPARNAAAPLALKQQQGQHQQRRACQLVKSPRLPSGWADFVIREAGIRGLETVSSSSTRPTST